MPCHTEDHAYCEHSKGECSDRSCQDLIEYYKKMSDEATRHLCNILKEGSISIVDNELKEWWEKHKMFDSLRNKVESKQILKFNFNINI